MFTDSRIIFSLAILLGMFNSFGKCESYNTDLMENGNFEKFFRENLDDKTFVVAIDVSYGNMDKVKKFWANYNVSSDSQIYFGIIRESGYETSNDSISAKEMVQRINSLESSTSTRTPRRDLFQSLQAIASLSPSDLDVLFFTGRPAAGRPSHKILDDKLSEKHIRGFVIWSGDSPLNVNALNSIARSSGGHLKFFSIFAEDADYDEETSDSHFNETSKPEKSAHDSDIISDNSRNFNNADNIGRRLGEVSLSAESNVEENKEQKLAEIIFPEQNLFEEMPKRRIENNFQSRNSSSEKQQTRGNVFIPVKVEVSSSSTLYCLPGSNHRIGFDVTNNFFTPLFLTFSASNVRNVRILNIHPNNRLLNPMERITVDVTIQALLTEANSVEGQIGFVASTKDNERTIRQTLIYIINKTITDSWAPKINYSYKGDCRQHDKPDTCDTEQWSVEATVQDEESGLKKILSEPYGLLFQQPFLAGTKSQVTVLYSASCCQSKVDIYAEDGKGNYIKLSLDINNQGLLTGEIAAIAVGVLLLIFIIIAIVVAIALIRRRNQSKLIIPRYQSSSSS